MAGREDKDFDRERSKKRFNTGESSENPAGTGNNNKFRSTVRSLMYGLDSFISAKTVVGDPMTIGDTIILPLVDVSFGVGAGSFGANTKNTDGNSGGGLHGKMSPTAVLVIKDGIPRVVNVKDQDMLTKVMGMAPDVVDKVSSFIKSKDDKEPEKSKGPVKSKNEHKAGKTDLSDEDLKDIFKDISDE